MNVSEMSAAVNVPDATIEAEGADPAAGNPHTGHGGVPHASSAKNAYAIEVTGVSPIKLQIGISATETTVGDDTMND